MEYNRLRYQIINLKMQNKEAIKSAIKKRSTGQNVAKPSGHTSEELKFFSHESGGMQLQPKTVLLVSIIYMGVVVVLHIFGKLRQSNEETAWYF